MRRRLRKTEAGTVIVGAGAAGLAAACELSSEDHPVLVLDARDRIGGRIHTEYRGCVDVPIELGAEFIHGDSSAVFDWLERADQVAVDASRNRWMLQQEKLQPANGVLEDLKKSFDRIPPPRRDLPFGEFLRRHARALRPAARELARMMVEGFDAADAAKISTREVLDEWGGEGAADAPTFRPARGYDALVQSIRQSLNDACTTLQLGTIVKQIAWRKGRVTLDVQRHGEPVRLEAERAIVTLPLGVLQLPPASSHSVRFTPELSSKRTALMQLAAGPVIKVMLRFARPFWAEIEHGRYREAGFFFAPQAPFPTFWTSLPLRTSMLVAWSAGPNATRLADKDRDQVIACVFESLRALFGRGVNYASLVESVCWHDWQRDPFACGAYSYLLANGAGARRSLATPVENTLFFAGEASDTEDEAATVGGALQSGRRAAREVLESAARSRRRRKRTAR
jgi:monoamine oxidase